MATFNEMPVLTESDRVRFWKKVDRNGPTMPGMTTPCWLWTAAKFTVGYGAFKLGGKQHGSHRIAFLLGGGVLTEANPQANHRCRNRACCNPDHVYAGDHQQNMDDMAQDGTLPRGENHGAAKLTDEQCTYIRSSPLSLRAIAREVGVSKTQISDIRSGRSRHPAGCSLRRKGKG